MVDYLRPELPKQTFYDADGAVIDYGNRWRAREGRRPPEDTYEVESNLERFAPLHLLADALIDYLRVQYDVAVSEEPALEGASRIVRLVPSNADGAPLTIEFTTYPGLIVRTGLLHDSPFPTCGCDACDETPGDLADDLEETVLAVAEGRFSEGIRPSGGLNVYYETRSREGWRRARGENMRRPEQLLAAAERLNTLANGWQPWSLRK